MVLGEYWKTEWLACIICGHKFAYNSDYTWIKKPSREICQCCVASMSREEALASVPRYPHYHFCQCPSFYGYTPHPDGLYEPVAVCKNCLLPTWANRKAHLDCLGCGDKYTITNEHSNSDLCPNCL